MAIFSVDKFRAQDISARAKYFEQGEEFVTDRQLKSGEEDYFLKSHDVVLSEIAGTGSVALGLGIDPQPGDYELLFIGFNPRTGESFVSNVRRGQLDKDRKANCGFSTSFNADKSISLLYATAPKEIQALIEKAMMEAARRSIESAEQRGVIGTRSLQEVAPRDFGETIRNINSGESGKTMEDSPGRIISLNYLHFTNRAQEPHLHVHCEIPNLVLGDDGKWRTINGSELYARQKEMAAMYDGYLYNALKRDCPDIARLLAVDFDRSGLIAPCVSQELIQQYSSRREEIKDTMREEGLVGASAARSVAKRTRDEKELVDPEELRARWKEEIGDINREPGDLSPATLLMVEQLLFRGSSTFNQRDLDRVAAQLAICHGGPDDMPAITTQICRQLGVVELPGIEGKHRLYTTEAFRQMEVDLLRYARKAAEPAERFALTDTALADALARVEAEKGFALRAEQRAALIHAASGAQLSIIEGAAGTGKSQSLAALRAGYEAAGHRVLGLAPSGAAAAELEKSAGIESRTIHALLMRIENDNPEQREVLAATDVIVVDEAGMVDTRTLHKLLGYAERAGSKVILTGDSKQLESVGSASTLSMLSDAVGTAELIQIARQRDLDDRAISQSWFGGLAGDAAARMTERGLLRAEGEGTPTAIAMMLHDAAQAHGAGVDWREILLLADRNSQVRELNRRVREYRQQQGELDTELEQQLRVSNDRGYTRLLDVAPGDRLMLRRNAMIGETPVYNGDRATLIGIEQAQAGVDKEGEPIFDHRLTVRLDRTGEQLTFGLADYDRLDHAYAMTVHKSQGLTVDRAFYLASETADRRSAYVAFTRSREACPFYFDEASAEAFAENTRDFTAKLTALDADPVSKNRVLAEPAHPASVRVIEQAQPATKALLERSGERFAYAQEEPAPAKATPEIIVIPDTRDDATLARARGYAVTELIDLPADTRRSPGKPYAALPTDVQRIALTADDLPPIPEPKLEAHQDKEATYIKEESRPMAERHFPRDKASSERETQAMRRDVDLIEYAEHLGYAVDEPKSKTKYKAEQFNGGRAAVMTKGGDQIDVFVGNDGNWCWYSRKDGGQGKAGGDYRLGGDIFKLFQRDQGGSFAQAKDNVRDYAGGKLPSYTADPAEQRRLDAERAERAKAEAEKEARRIEAGTKKAEFAIKTMGRQDTYLGPVRGISSEVLAETSWRTNRHGSAVFPHIGLDLKFSGYEYRGHDLLDDEESPKKNRGFSANTEKGVYVANPLRPSAPRPTPTEIIITESGVDTLSLYQMASPEERQRAFFVGVTGQFSAKAINALAAFAEQHGIQRFGLAYDRDEGGDGMTRRLSEKLRAVMPDAQIEDVRERVGMQVGEDPNEALRRLQREQTAQPIAQGEQDRAAQPAAAPTAEARPAPVPAPSAETASSVPEQEQQQQDEHDRDLGMDI